jgi:hypothetical protein
MSDDKREKLTLDRSTRPQESRDQAVRSSEKKTRRKKGDEVDEFYVDPSEIPDGFTVEWKRFQTLGKEDGRNMMELEKDGWEPAQPKDFPSLCSRTHKEPTITHKDLILMIRPKELTQEALVEERDKASKVVRDKLVELGLSKPGEGPRLKPQVTRTYERAVIPD